MGPNNIALVKLSQADQALRSAQQRLEAATRDVRIQEKRTKNVRTQLDEAQKKLRESQSKAANSELELKARDAHIEKLRGQQSNTRNNKEYQAILLEISTCKADRNKIEDATMKALEDVERTQGQIKELTAQHQSESAKLEQVRAQITDRAAAIQQEIDQLTPERQKAYEAVSPQAAAVFDRLADRLDGEVMAALSRPNPKREEYVCTACNLDVVTDVYNRLHTRDDLVFCPSCGRILYIPEDLTPEAAVNKKKEVKASRPRSKTKVAAAVPRQSSAVDVLKSMQPEVEEASTPATPVTETSQTAEADGSNPSDVGQNGDAQNPSAS